MRSDNMMALHANNHYHYSNKVVSGTNQTVEYTYDAEIGCVVEGAVEQETTVQGSNLCPSDWSKWTLYNGAYIDDEGYCVLPELSSYALVKILWNKRNSTVAFGLNILNAIKDNLDDTKGVRLNANYYNNNVKLGENGFARYASTTESFVSSGFGTYSPYDEYIANSEIIEFKIFRSSSYGTEPYKFKNMCVEARDSVIVEYEPFVPNSPSPDYPQPIKSAKGNVVSEGRNLFDIHKVHTRYNISYSNGIFTATDNDNQTYLGYKIQCFSTSGYIVDSAPGTSECYSPGKVVMTMKIVDGTVRIRIANRGKTVEFTIAYNLSDLGVSVGDTITVAFDVIDITIGASKFKNLMVLKGTYTADTLPPYQPYYPPSTAQSAYPLYTGDKWLVGDKYVFNKEVLVLDGTTDGKRFTGADNFRNTGFNLAYLSTNVLPYSKPICTHFTTTNNIFGSENIFATSVLGICMADSRTGVVSTDTPSQIVSKINTVLAAQYATGTPVTIVYQRATPLEIADTQQLKSHPRYTHITTVADEGYLTPDVTAKVKTY